MLGSRQVACGCRRWLPSLGPSQHCLGEQLSDHRVFVSQRHFEWWVSLLVEVLDQKQQRFRIFQQFWIPAQQCPGNFDLLAQYRSGLRIRGTSIDAAQDLVAWCEIFVSKVIDHRLLSCRVRSLRDRDHQPISQFRSRIPD